MAKEANLGSNMTLVVIGETPQYSHMDDVDAKKDEMSRVYVGILFMFLILILHVSHFNSKHFLTMTTLMMSMFSSCHLFPTLKPIDRKGKSALVRAVLDIRSIVSFAFLRS